ncbi:SSI family serine proteinase inhibitor [Streptomyces sp. NPDC017254]|uniref:SSI family serine proteinase inhibitor n=1 Tax=unclassified Streptomyces TaxID=2593676 RepID=UPI0037AF399C
MKKITAFAAVVLLASGLAGTAAASPAPARTGDARILLTAARTQGGTEKVDAVWLGCAGQAGVGHPYREDACEALAAADGDFDALRGEPQGFCTAEYAPVTLTARGTYEDRTVDWSRTYPNNCEAVRDTGAVFWF